MGRTLPFAVPRVAAWRDDDRNVLPSRAVVLWAVGIGLYVGGDAATTIAGIDAATVTEANPLVAALVLRFGIAGMVVPKLAMLAVGLGLWTTMSPRYRDTVPLLFGASGAGITTWNLFVLLGPIG